MNTTTRLDFIKHASALVGILLMANSVYALNLGGIQGTDFSGNDLDFGQIPSDTAQVCEQAMKAMIKKCKESGYENWTVTRRYSHTDFSGNGKHTSSGDQVIGSVKCSEGENSIDEVLIARWDLLESVSKACYSGETRNTQKSLSYSCTFTCSAWNCDPNVTAFEVSACSVLKTEQQENPNADPFDLISPGCQDVAEKSCKARGENCALEKPCYYKEINGLPPDDLIDSVFCKCSCPAKLPSSTIDEETYQRLVKPETFDFQKFKLSEWNKNRQNCFKKVAIRGGSETEGLKKETTNSTGLQIGLKPLVKVADDTGKTIGFISQGAQSILGKTKLGFSKIAGWIVKNPNEEKAIIGMLDPTHMEDSITSINSGTPVQALVKGMITGSGYVTELENYNAINPKGMHVKGWKNLLVIKPTVRFATPVTCSDENTACTAWSSCQSGKQTRTCTTQNSSCTVYPLEKDCITLSTTPTCTESWNCANWNAWSSFGDCQSSSTQTKTRTRTCTDMSNCGTDTNRPSVSESESQTCTYVAPKSYHEKEQYITWANGATQLTVGQTVEVSLSAGEKKYYVFNLVPGETYESYVVATSGAPFGYNLQQRFGPPQLTYVDTAAGKVQFGGGPDVAVYEDVQKVAVEVGPASVNSTGQITIAKVS